MKKLNILVAAHIFLLAIVLGMPIFAHAASDTMKIEAIDLGGANTGEATMVSDASGKAILIDSGDIKTRAVFKWLDANGYKNKKFDVLVTHWHDDHAGNTGEIIRRYKVGTVYIPKTDYLYDEETAYYKYERSYAKDVVDSAKLKGTRIVYLKKGQTIKAGTVTGKVLYCCGSPRSESLLPVDYINNQSAAIMFSGGGAKFLAAADIEKQAENRILNSHVSIKADIFKLSHHGLRTSNKEKFLDAVDPIYAYFTSNRSTPTSYTRADIEESVTRAGWYANVMGTGYNGTIIYTCKDGKITVKAKRNTGIMYQRLIDKETGSTRRVTFVFNTASRVRKIKELLNSEKYYNQQLNADGTMFSGTMVKRDGSYYLEKNGVGAYNTFARKGRKTYWFDYNGKRKEGGFLNAYGRRYYLNTSGEPYRVCGWKTVDGRKYYFVGSKYEEYSKNTEGMMLTGFRTVMGKEYYFMDSDCSIYKSADHGRLMIGFFTADGNLYYGANDKVTGFKTEDYGAIVKNWATISGRLYYMGTDGIVRKGWQTIDGKRYYMGTNGTTAVNKFVEVDGAVYYFGEDGAMATGFTAISDAMYYFGEDGVMATGWIELDGNTYYAGDDGKLARGITEIDGKTYHFDENDGHLIEPDETLDEENDPGEENDPSGENELNQENKLNQENELSKDNEPDKENEMNEEEENLPEQSPEGSTELPVESSYADTGDTAEPVEDTSAKEMTDGPDGSDDEHKEFFEVPSEDSGESHTDSEASPEDGGEGNTDSEDSLG